MTIHSSIITWEIPRTKEPGRLQSKVSQRVGHNLAIKQQQQNTYVCVYLYLYISIYLSIYRYIHIQIMKIINDIFSY